MIAGRLRDVAIIAALATLVMLPSLLQGPGYTDSAQYNIVWTAQLADAFTRGEAYPRWLPGSFAGLGSPTFYFYPPLAFWLAGAADAAGLSSEAAINTAALLLLITSGIAMLAWLRFGGARHPLAGAALYAIAPYHLTDFYLRGALAEFAAFVWLPLIALGIAALGNRRWAMPLLAIAYAGIILSHTPTALLASVFLIVPQGLWRVRSDWRLLPPLALGLATGLALAALYLLPALALQPEVMMALMQSPYYVPAHWSLWGAAAPISPRTVQQFALLAVLPAGVGIIALVVGRQADDRPGGPWPLVALMTAILSAGLVPIVWQLPLLDRVQFPWRLLTVAEFAAVTTLALARIRPLVALLVAALFVQLSLLAVQGGRAGIALRVRYPEMLAGWQRDLPDAPEYLPRGTLAPEVTDLQRRVATRRYDRPLATGGRASADADGDLTMDVTTPGIVLVRRFRFPIWAVSRDGVAVPMLAGDTDGLIRFAAQPGRYRLVRMPLAVERLAGWISLAGLVMLIGISVRAARSTPRPPPDCEPWRPI